MKITGYVMRPTTRSTAPTAAISGHRLGPGAGVAAADSVVAAGSIDETSASRV